MKLYFKYFALQIKSSFEYRTSLIFDMFSSTISTITCFFAIVCLFQKYDHIASYNMFEVLITYSMITLAFAISECLFRGFDQFDSLVKTGELDRLLIRPRSIFLQVLGYKIEFKKLGRIIFSAIVLGVALAKSSILWSPLRIVCLILMFVCSIIIFGGMFMLYSGISIFTVEGLEAINIITNGGRDLCYYPLDVYTSVLRKFFTFIIPLACVNYLPLQFLLGRSNNVFYAVTPLFGILFAVVCYIFFRWALTKYKSTGS